MDVLAILRGFLGIGVLIFILFLLSENRKKISWKLVIAGMLTQIVFAILILKVPFAQVLFEKCSSFFVVVLDFTRKGSDFLFGGLLDTNKVGFLFAFQILPTIIFFSALTSLFFYLGILQKIVYGLSWLLSKTVKISGAENLSTTANIFLGQTEAPLLIKPYLEKMTRSEIFCVMVGGMANTAGGVLAAYVGFLGGSDPVQQLYYAKHLLAASVMSAPATIVIAKILIPQTETIDEKIDIPQEKIGTNVLEAISNGTTDGIQLAINVGAMLIVFIAMIAMVNYILGDLIGSTTGLNTVILQATNGQYQALSLQFLLGYLCAPIVWLLGVAKEDMVYIGQLLGEKTILNEFVAYTSLAKMKADNLIQNPKSILLATYILSGFANFASIGIQIGGIGVLAPNKRPLLSQLGIKALIGGTFATLMMAAIVGMLS
jgi:CNT family concentrative nucleoside transporter